MLTEDQVWDLLEKIVPDTARLRLGGNMVKDCDDNEIKVGDEVERVRPNNTPDPRFGQLGKRYVISGLGEHGNELHSNTGLGLGGAQPTCFRKVAPAKPVYPFKVGDVVECLNVDQRQGGRLYLTEGRTYEVRRVREAPSGNPQHSTGSFMVTVVDDRQTMAEYLAARFCAPGESRVALRKRIAELENALKDTRINTVASGLRDEVRVLSDRLSEAHKDLGTVLAQRDAWKERAAKAETKAAQLDRMNDALAREARVTEARVMPDGYVVLTKAAK